jgi:uncharacterized membrane protein
MFKLKNLSKQAKLALFGYIILILSVFLPYKLSDEEDDNNYYLKERVIYSVIMLLPIFISVFTINCMVTGTSTKGCGSLSWINAVLVFIWALLVFIFSFKLMKDRVGVEDFSNEIEKKKNEPPVKNEDKKATNVSIDTKQGNEPKSSELLN